MILGKAKGYKISNGEVTDTEAVVYLVDKKVSKDQLPASEIIPETENGVRTDVIEVGEILPMHRTKHRPVIGGVSGMVEKGSACSIGVVVFKDGKPHVLTNEHCVYPYEKGQRYLQPSPWDGGTETIGTIEYDKQIKSGVINKMDSHLVPLDSEYELSVKGIDYKREWATPELGMKFVKVGRTTGITRGVITHIDALATINMSRYDMGFVQFAPCLFALQNNYDIVNGGDSGSCIFTEDGRLLGQTFAAAPNLAIFIPSTTLREELGITLSQGEDTRETGFIAIGNWIEGNTLRSRVNMRREPRLGNNIRKVLPAGTKVEFIDYAGVENGLHWFRIML